MDDLEGACLSIYPLNGCFRGADLDIGSPDRAICVEIADRGVLDLEYRRVTRVAGRQDIRVACRVGRFELPEDRHVQVRVEHAGGNGR